MMRSVDREGVKMEWNVGCNLNITEDPSIFTQIRVKWGKVKVKSLCTA
jgi:hypothetical protein